MKKLGWLLIALDLFLPGFLPGPLRALYARTWGRLAADAREAWEHAADDWAVA